MTQVMDDGLMAQLRMLSSRASVDGMVGRPATDDETGDRNAEIT
jgi:hypothetical protein